MRRVVLLIVIVLLVGPTVGCGADGGDESATTTTAESTTTATDATTTTGSTETTSTASTTTTPASSSTTTATTTTSPPTTVTGLTSFRSPSGNIGCYIDQQGARCDIGDRTWQPPPKPADCPVDWGQGIELGSDGGARFICAGDTALDPTAMVLDYGRSIAAGAVVCTSQRDGMACRHTASDHGFRLARDSYEIR